MASLLSFLIPKILIVACFCNVLSKDPNVQILCVCVFERERGGGALSTIVFSGGISLFKLDRHAELPFVTEAEKNSKFHSH